MWLHKLLLFLLFSCICAEDIFQQIYHQFGKLLEESLPKNPNISIECKSILSTYSHGLQKDEKWTIKLFDASGKLPGGLMQYYEADLGNYDQCLEVETKIQQKNLIGKYCISMLEIDYATLIFTKNSIKHRSNYEFSKARMASLIPDVGLLLGTCVPDGCSADDMQAAYKGININIQFYDNLCETKLSQPELDSDAIAVISFFGVVLFIMAISTIYDIYLFYSEKKSIHPLLIAFSILTNTKKLLEVSSSPDQISCLHGIRFISAAWIVLVHSFLIAQAFPAQNSLFVIQWHYNKGNMFVMGATLAVDTFFFMSGFLIVYVYLKAISKGLKFNIVLFYFHRILRLTPVLAAMIILHLTLVKYIGNGPLYNVSVDRDLVFPCESNWWKTLLYIANYGKNRLYCVPQSWYLNADTQLYFLSPLLLIPLRRHPKLTLTITAFLTLCSTALCFAAGWIAISDNVWPGNPKLKFFRFHYDETFTRAAPWLLGIIFGYFIFKFKENKSKVKLNKLLVIGMWGIIFAILGSCVFGGYDPSVPQIGLTAVESAFFRSFVRPAWAFAIGCLILLCINGDGGIINWFLSAPLFQVLSRFSFSLYMGHYLVIYLMVASMRYTPAHSNYSATHKFWGDLMASLTFAYFLTLAFESPIIAIEKVLFKKEKAQTIKQTENGA